MGGRKGTRDGEREKERKRNRISHEGKGRGSRWMERESEKGKGMNKPRVWERDNWKKEKINPRYEVGKRMKGSVTRTRLAGKCEEKREGEKWKCK